MCNVSFNIILRRSAKQEVTGIREIEGERGEEGEGDLEQFYVQREFGDKTICRRVNREKETARGALFRVNPPTV